MLRFTNHASRITRWLAATSLALAPMVSGAQGTFVIRGGSIVPVSGPRITNGTVVIQNGRITSVGTNVQRGEDGLPVDGKTATLEVTPIEAERLAVAQGQGAIQLVLRGYGDPDSINTLGASSTDVLAALRDAPVATQPVVRTPTRRTTPRPPPPKPETTTVVVTPPPVVPARPDTSVVKVYRGNEMTTQKFEKDTTKRPPQR